ncbi:MAG: nucleoid-associated protein, YbaB/EbfC family [Candidatus Firestonebacteria bacterium RIFOXYA2_FULL_40_8]|nr:MAG: nucleoid-associated protein, YbaB/EbfC family [Candidatus Firestonebacteria bacterium RIFOXYA2_FULL_40_8]
MFDKMKQMYDLQKKAREIKKELEATIVNVEEAGGKIKISMNGEFKLVSISIDPYFLAPERKLDLENAIKRVISNGVGQSQSASAGKMKELTKGMNFPGL